MVDKNSAPAFSLGTSTRQQVKNNGVPGPGTYTSNSLTKSPQSLSKTNKQERFGNYQTFVPGPGTYENKNSSHIPTASILSRKNQLKKAEIPGPGNYEPDYKKFVKSNSGYRLGKAEKISDETKSKVKLPGPGTYETAKSTLLGLNQATQFDPADRKLKIGFQSTNTPAPNTYNQNGLFNGTVKNEPKISFAKSQRSLTTNSFAPPPNTYNLKSQIEEGATKKKGFSLSFRPSNNTQQKVKNFPGPGTYEYDSVQKLKKSTPSFSISKSIRLKIEREQEIKKNPGPNTYESKVSAFQHKSFTMGRDFRKGIENKNNVPGPGNYELKLQNNQPSFSVSKSQRKSLGNLNKYQPGPGEYEPKMLYTSQCQPIKIGTDHRRTFEDKRSNPGPGSYNTELKGGGGKSFGHQKRIPETKQSFVKNPGPGNYQIPSTVSNLPQYTGTKKA